jgi:pilus assembly protein CpaB
MNIKAIIPLVAGLCVGGIALKLGLRTLQKARGSSSETVQVWAASTDIPRGVAITKEMLKPIAYPASLVPAGAFRQQSELLGRVPRIDAPAGLPLLADMLLPPGTPAGVHVPAGLRAVAVKIDESSGVDFHLEPGSRVDVVGYFQIQEQGRRDTIARTLIENVEVAAVGAKISPVGGEEAKGTRQARAVTLLVKPDQVPILHLAEQRGKIKLSLRGREDGSVVGKSAPVSGNELVDAAAPQEQAAESQDKSAGEEASRHGVLGWLRNLFGFSQPELKVELPPPAGAPPVPPAEPEWVVRVYRGAKSELVRFKSRSSREPVENPTSGRGGSAACGVAYGESGSQTSSSVPTSVGPVSSAEGSHRADSAIVEPEPQEPSE